MRVGYGCSVVALIAATASAGDAAALANSFEDYAGAQGVNGWYYGYFDMDSESDEFVEMGFYGDMPAGAKILDDIWATSSTWNPTAIISQDWVRPNKSAGANHDTGRRWVSSVNGTVQLTGAINMLANPNPVGDGVLAMISVDGVEVFSSVITHGSGITNYAVFANVEVGSTIDFRVGAQENHFADATQFSAAVTLVPAPGAVALMGLGGLAATRRRR